MPGHAQHADHHGCEYKHRGPEGEKDTNSCVMRAGPFSPLRGFGPQTNHPQCGDCVHSVAIARRFARAAPIPTSSDGLAQVTAGELRPERVFRKIARSLDTSLRDRSGGQPPPGSTSEAGEEGIESTNGNFAKLVLACDFWR